MPRSTPKVYAHQRHKKVLKFTKGQFGSRHRLFRRANEAMLKSLFYAYRDRRNKRRDFRRLWIARVNAAARLNGLNYSNFIHGLKKASVQIDRKVLAHLAVHDLATFGKLADLAKAQLLLIVGANPLDVTGGQMAPMSKTLADEQAIKNVVAHISTFNR